MTKLAFLLAFGAGAVSAAQVEAPRGGFRTNYIGEGGSYQQPSAGAGDYLETGSRQQGGNGTFGPIAAPIHNPSIEAPPSSAPAEEAAVSDSHQSAQPVQPAPTAPTVKPDARAPQKEEDRGRYSLWGGLAQPPALPKDKIGEISEDEAMGLGRTDYERRILGLAARPEADADGKTLKDSVASAPAAVPSDGPQAGEIFVSFDIDLKNHPEQYRDALAGLSSAAGFRPDARFEPRFSRTGAERASVWGWMPSEKIGAAMQVPNVAKLQIEDPARGPGSARSAGAEAGAMTDILIGVRLPAELSSSSGEARKYASRALDELASAAGFAWKKTIGYQQPPGSKSMVLIVSGAVPIRSLDRVLAHRDVVKISPVPPPLPASLEAPAAAEQPFKARFLAYVLSHAPFLIVATVIMVAPGVLRLLHVFVPYT